jgi:hypothetical protein
MELKAPGKIGDVEAAQVLNHLPTAGSERGSPPGHGFRCRCHSSFSLREILVSAFPTVPVVLGDAGVHGVK